MQLQTADNPLLEFAPRQRFDAIQPAHVGPAIDTLLNDARKTVSRVTDDDVPARWDEIVAPLEVALNRLDRAWNAITHLNEVVDTPELRAEHNAALAKMTAFWTELSQNLALYDKYKCMAAGADFAQWSTARRTVVTNELRDFRLGGADLAAADKDRLRQVKERIARLGTRFAENVLDATNDYALYLDDEQRLLGIPPDTLQMYREAAAADDRPGYKITLQAPSYLPLMQYAQDRALREQLYRAYFTCASEFGPAARDNSVVMIELLQLRREQAQLLGMRDFGEYSLATKMAETPQEVVDFLRDLARRARPHAERDLRELQDFAARALDLPQLQAWDHAYASEKLRQSRYAFSEQEVKQYFPEPQVLAGVFRLFEELFGITIRQEEAPVWHPAVRFYRIDRGDATLGHVYLDLYARPHKQGGAWQGTERSRYRSTASLQTPVAFLVCNFSKPLEGKPALFTHGETLTLLHEFGHGLHHLLTRVDEPAVAGTHGVEWDAIELPSQFMENFAWEWDGLQRLAGHVDTRATLPRALFDKMYAARNFQSGLQTLRQVEFALFDMLAHTQLDPAHATPADLLALLEQVRREVAVIQPPDFNRMPWRFSHIFAGGYAAGYYSYKWAEVLSCDAFAAFEEAGDSGSILNPALGQRFLDEVLAVGGSRPAMESFVAFRGRKPTIDALLRHHGMSA